MRKQILIIAQYLVEAEEYDFWDKETHRLDDQINKTLKKQFPDNFSLTNELNMERYSLSYQSIDFSKGNVLKCPVCKQLITDRTKPHPIYRLDTAKELEGVMMCSSCAYELEYDIKCGKSIESLLEKFK